jgi:hypothetical protein
MSQHASPNAMDKELIWQAGVKQTVRRTALVVLSVGLVLLLLLLANLPTLVATLLTLIYALYVLLPYFLPVRYKLNAAGVRWGQGIDSRFRPWDSFKVYRLQAGGIELSAYSRRDGAVPMLNNYRAVFLPYGNLPPTDLEAAVAAHLPLDILT